MENEREWHSPKADGVSWFAMRVFNRQILKVKADLENAGMQTYMALKTVDRMRGGALVYEQVPIVPSLLFARTLPSRLVAYKQDHFTDVMLYSAVPGGAPEPIPDAQMDMFILVTSRGGGRDVEFLGEDRPVFRNGERVRVVDGIYKGAEGIVKRIRRDRKLLVAVEGVAVVAVSKIPFEFLERI